MPGKPFEGVVGCRGLRAHKGRERTGQGAKQGLSVGVLAVGQSKNLVAQSLKFCGNDDALGHCVYSTTRTHDQFPKTLHHIVDVAQRAFRLGNRVFLGVQCALVCLYAVDAGQCTLGLGGCGRVVAGGVDAFARCQVLLQIAQRGLTRHEIGAGVVVGVGTAQACKRGCGHVFSPAGAELSAQSLHQGIKNTLCNLDHFCGGLVSLLILQQLGRFFVQIDA